MNKEPKSTDEKTENGVRYIETPGCGKDEVIDWLLNRQVRSAVQIPGDASRRQLQDLREKQEALSTLAAAIETKDPIDKMLRTQMSALHNCAMQSVALASLATDVVSRDRHLNTFVKLSSTFVKLECAYTQRNRKIEQKVTVEHIHVAPGGQAAIGTFEASSQPSTPHKQPPKEIAAPNEQPFSIRSSETQIKDPVKET